MITLYISLMRLDNITGLWLLLFSSLSGILLASHTISYDTCLLLILFTIGSCLMRPAGCIINDILDKDIDRCVHRTKYRPLAIGTLKIYHAFIILLFLLSFSLILLLYTNRCTIILGVISMCMIIVYPLCKRYIWCPQLFLGFTFNMGSLMGATAIKSEITIEAILFYLGCVTWTLSYDTIYSYQDMEEDKKLGLYSTAFCFGKKNNIWLNICYLLSLIFWMYSAIASSLNNIFYFVLCIIALILYRQNTNLHVDVARYMNIFKNQFYVGLLLVCGMLLDRLIGNLLFDLS
ncbi:4-hydroxybenzoate octaprenyltransferase [Wolbachia endosymbiont of Howardula sp.]|uniref:4-hydroxybenzoate octaprenyltransferase n=1 Tax=Wolbachia endosymbiont of Howardula sp. TaxID=2916816 RepID=UPI00217D0534|nr:4-hydroxybenzoate octaprenyltransferase [Wolbachia endosymbiont of Howardula sp.]UWI82959.1 UbiA family prenyltransferase [Wolbachia endosymbiont of Howardula sp.]